MQSREKRGETSFILKGGHDPIGETCFWS